MRTKWVLPVLLVISGCGGGGSGGGVPPITDPLILVMQAQIDAINAENTPNLMATIDAAYFEDCRDRIAYQSFWQGRFDTPNWSYTVSNLQVQTNQRDDVAGTGWLNVTYTVTINNNGNVTNNQGGGQRFFKRSGGVWREMGDGSCP